MRQVVRRLSRSLPAFQPAVPWNRGGYGQRITMASVSTASNGANGKPNHWHGTGAAEFDMRSELYCAFMYWACH